jgi:hypothetical protein
MMKEINISIPIDVLKRIPEGKIMGAYEIDIGGKTRQVIGIQWVESWDYTTQDILYGFSRKGSRIRTDYYAIDNGEYCGEVH